VPNKDKIKQRESARRHYAKHGDKVKASASAFKKIAKARNKAFVAAHLSVSPCVDCGEKDPVVLDFDHVRGIKVNNVSHMVLNGVSLEKLKTEMDKCEIRCANCHRRKTRMRAREVAISPAS
jgi:hypothetical protein